MLTDRAGALLVLDEVQTGIGRAGHWFGQRRTRGDRDVVTLAKGLGGGLPIGACVAFGAAATLLGPGAARHHLRRQPGRAAAAGLAVLDTIERDGLLDHVQAAGERLASVDLGAGSPLVDHVRGRGLLRGWC